MPKQFNLKDFKAGSPAITRGGKTAYYLEDNGDSEYPIVVQMGIFLIEYSVTLDGRVFRSKEHPNDIISMKE